MSTNAFDAIVVGAGAGGGAAAWTLTDAGARVLLLEAGPWFVPEQDYRLSDRLWERTGFPRKPGSRGEHVYAGMQSLDPAREDLLSWSAHLRPRAPRARREVQGYHHARGVGGSTLRYTGEAQRMNPAAMAMHSRFGVAADWPLDYAELEPYYEKAERVVGVAGPSDGDGRGRRAPPPLPAHPLSHASRLLGEGVRALGMGWQANDVAALSRPHRGRPGCNYCGQCARGCPRRDKGSADVTFIAEAVAGGRCEVRADRAVLRLLAGDDDRIEGVEYLDPDGSLQRAAAPAVILACGAVETPRLLLNSSDARSPQGLANESGLVGRNFMETLHWTSVGLHPQRVDSHRGLPSDAISWSHNAPDAIEGVVGGCRFSPGVIEADLAGPLAYARRAAGGWGRAHHGRMREVFGHALGVGAIGESLPHAGSFVDLDPGRTDDHGRPLARINSRLDEQAVRRIEFMARTSRDILAAAGVESLLEESGSYDFFSATHVFGTCRMGTDSGNSVVDAHGGSHRWRNLFVADASVFPSSGGGEGPALTVQALAIRTAEHVVRLGKAGSL